MTECQFVSTESNVVVCRRCGRIVKTPHPPEKVHAECPSRRIIGLGDLVARCLRWLGIERIVKATGKGCGCAKRQDALNRAVPFG